MADTLYRCHGFCAHALTSLDAPPLATCPHCGEALTAAPIAHDGACTPITIYDGPADEAGQLAPRTICRSCLVTI